MLKEFSVVVNDAAIVASAAVYWTGSHTVDPGLKLSVAPGVSWTVMSRTATDLGENRPRSLFFLDSIYHVLGIAQASLLLTHWNLA